MNEDHPLYKWHISIGFFYDAVRRGNCFSIEICLFNFGYLINYWVVLKYIDTSLCIYIQIHLSISTKIEFAAYHGSACRRPLQKPLQNNLEWRVRAPTLPLRCSSRHTLQNQMNPNPKLVKCPTCLLQSSARQQKLGPHTACLLPQSIVLETRVKTDTWHVLNVSCEFFSNIEQRPVRAAVCVWRSCGNHSEYENPLNCFLNPLNIFLERSS